jgi:hypothetical protein
MIIPWFAEGGRLQPPSFACEDCKDFPEIVFGGLSVSLVGPGLASENPEKPRARGVCRHLGGAAGQRFGLLARRFRICIRGLIEHVAPAGPDVAQLNWKTS